MRCKCARVQVHYLQSEEITVFLKKAKQGCIKLNIPPPPEGGEKYLVGWARKSSREEGKGKGEREKERREKRQKGRQGKREGKGKKGKRKGKGMEGLVFSLGKGLIWGRGEGKKEKGRERVKGGKLDFLP